MAEDSNIKAVQNSEPKVQDFSANIKKQENSISDLNEKYHEKLGQIVDISDISDKETSVTYAMVRNVKYFIFDVLGVSVPTIEFSNLTEALIKQRLDSKAELDIIPKDWFPATADNYPLKDKKAA